VGGGGLEIMVILVVGKSGAGKTTYAKKLAEELRTTGRHAQVLDGDVFRTMMGNKDFTDDGRRRNLESIALTAQLIESNGRTAIVACVAPTKALREMMRKMWEESRLVYLPGGTLWEGTEYEVPDVGEFNVYRK
jgi:adenylylsulfate kinase